MGGAQWWTKRLFYDYAEEYASSDDDSDYVKASLRKKNPRVTKIKNSMLKTTITK